VQRVGWDRELVSGTEHELAPVDPEGHKATAAAKRLLLPRPAVEGRVAVLGARLARVEHELLGAVAVGVHIDEQHQALLA
jgi:hypothetical protein